MKFGVGQALRRKEDDALLRGAGRYVADYAPAGTLHAVVVRSPHAHARFRISDIGKRARDAGRAAGPHRRRYRRPRQSAAAMAVIPGVDIGCRPIRFSPANEVRHVGDAIAFVVADTLERGEGRGRSYRDRLGAAAACDRRARPRWTTARRWSGRTGPAISPSRSTLGDAEATARGLRAGARTRSRSTIVNQRLVTNYLDTRGVVAEYDGRRTASR